jgi:CMP-N,N'-diacetyllegionaminic acid synthase
MDSICTDNVPTSPVLALIPARSGSKSIPDKNIRSFRGRPLLAHSIEQALAASTVDKVVVSTDSPRYAEIARSFGAEVGFLRPAHLATDEALDIDVFLHALDWLERAQGFSPGLCVHLRPTYPNRSVEDIDGAVNLLRSNPRVASVRSVALAPHSPLKMWRLGDDTCLEPILEDALDEPYNRPRQQLPPVYIQNAAVDVVRTAVIRGQRSMTGARIGAYLMDSFHDIDTLADLEAAAFDLPPQGPRYRFVFDIDGILAHLSQGDDYRRARPIVSTIAIINRLHGEGHTIVLHSARGTSTGIDWKELTHQQLARWDVRYDELRFGKPAADFYVDDRSLPLSSLERWAAGRR